MAPPPHAPDSKKGTPHPKQKEGTPTKGIEALLSPGKVSQEPFPMLYMIFDRLARSFISSWRAFTSENVDFVLEDFSSVRFGDHIEKITSQTMIGIFRAEEWDGSGLLVSDHTLNSTIIDVLLGGKKEKKAEEPPSKKGGRDVNAHTYTNIERNLVGRMMKIILKDLENAFNPLTSVNLSLDRIESTPKFASIVRPNSLAFVANFRMTTSDQQGGFFQFIIPSATLDPIRPLLVDLFLGEKFGKDTLWEEHLTSEVRQSSFILRAFLDEFDLPLREIFKWQKGHVLALNAEKDGLIILRCYDRNMFMGKAGQNAGSMAVLVENTCGLPDQKEGVA